MTINQKRAVLSRAYALANEACFVETQLKATLANAIVWTLDCGGNDSFDLAQLIAQAANPDDIISRFDPNPNSEHSAARLDYLLTLLHDLPSYLSSWINVAEAFEDV